MKFISSKEIKEKLANHEDFQLIDIREPFEFEEGAIGLNIPMDEVLDSIAKISKTKQVVIYCKTGKRANAIIYMLEKLHGYNNLYNLKGGFNSYLDS